MLAVMDGLKKKGIKRIKENLTDDGKWYPVPTAVCQRRQDRSCLCEMGHNQPQKNDGQDPNHQFAQWGFRFCHNKNSIQHLYICTEFVICRIILTYLNIPDCQKGANATGHIYCVEVFAILLIEHKNFVVQMFPQQVLPREVIVLKILQMLFGKFGNPAREFFRGDWICNG